MLVAEKFYSWDHRENRAIDKLCPGLNQALLTGKTVVVRRFTTSLTNAQLVEIAVSLCKRTESNVAVVGSHDGRTVAFVPLFATTSFVRTQVGVAARRGRARAHVPWSASGTVAPRGPVTI